MPNFVTCFVMLMDCLRVVCVRQSKDLIILLLNRLKAYQFFPLACNYSLRKQSVPFLEKLLISECL